MGIDLNIAEEIGKRFKTLENVLTHEFGHALDVTYDLENNDDILEIYNNLTEIDILQEISGRAAEDIREFIAECFKESFYSDCSQIAKDVRKIIDKKGRK